MDQSQVYQSSPMHQSRPYSDLHFQQPSSYDGTHNSSPQSYPGDLAYGGSHRAPPYQQPQNYPYPRPRPHKSNSGGYSHALQVTTAQPAPHEHDPSEYTARPSNAHHHAQFHSQSLPVPLNHNHAQGQLDLMAASSNPHGALGLNLHGAPSSSMPHPSDHDYTTSTPGLSQGLSRPLIPQEQERLAQLDRLKFFLATAPSRWDASAAASSNPTPAIGPDTTSLGPNGTSNQVNGLQTTHPALSRFLIPTTQEYVTCVLWNGLYHITGTDIVRALVFRFEAFGRPVRNMKKFEEGVFSDLRNLKPGVDACLEEPKSPFLDLLFKYQCIRTQKKQKVFYWFSVPHDRLFLDALERDLKREKMGQEPTTHITGEPALSFTYDPKRSLYDQFSKAQGGKDGEGELEAAVRRATEERCDENLNLNVTMGGLESEISGSEVSGQGSDGDDVMDGQMPSGEEGASRLPPALQGPNTPFFPMISLQGSPSYKQRRKKNSKLTFGPGKSSSLRGDPSESDDGNERGRRVQERGRGSRYGSADESIERDYSHLTASELFMKQARGELAPPNIDDRRRLHVRNMHRQQQQRIGPEAVYYHNGPDGLSSIPRPRSHEELQRHSYPIPGTMSAGYPSQTFAQAQSRGIPPSYLTDPAAVSVRVDPSMVKTKAFACPLFSCGRLFKRMEHLKRHLRTHTMERPYQCPKCKKKFSRSDNLTQHVRTHGKIDSDGLGGGNGGTTEWEDGADADRESGGAASEDIDELENDDAVYTTATGGIGMNLGMYGGATGMGMGMGMAAGMSGSGYGGVDGMPDVQMCEVEVQGDVLEVQGDEEGLMTTAGSDVSFINGSSTQGQQTQGQGSYYTTRPLVPSPPFTTTATDYTDAGAQWAVRNHASPAFSTISAPSPPPGSIPHIRSARNSLTSSPANYIPTASTSASGYNTDDYVTSISAPSHKQAFDHASLYPPGMLDSSGPGPIRRHRSMTPSLMRNGENIRRPLTASSGDFATMGSGTSPGSTGRGYHPYANAMVSSGYSSSQSRDNSAQSSPATYPLPLTESYASNTNAHESHSQPPQSTSNGQMQEQMRQMMTMNLDQQVDQAHSAMYGDGSASTMSNAGVTQGYGDMYRTDSPVQYASDLPVEYIGDVYGAPVSGQFDKQGLYVLDSDGQYQGVDEGYYSQTHVTL